MAYGHEMRGPVYRATREPSSTGMALREVLETRTARVALVAMSVFLVAGVDAALRPPGGLDLAVMKAVQRIDHPEIGPRLDLLGRLTDAGGAVLAWAATLGLFVVLRWWAPTLGVLAIPLGGVVNETVSRVLIQRTRPHLEELRHVSQNFEDRSFPSGHVVGAVLLYGFIWYVVGERVRNRVIRWSVRTFSGAVILLSGFDRVWSGAHWPSDVVGGYGLGFCLLGVLILVCKWLERDAAQLRRWVDALPPSNSPVATERRRRVNVQFWARRLLAVFLRPVVWALVRPSGPDARVHERRP